MQDDFFTIARGGQTKPLRLISGTDGITFEKPKRKRNKRSQAKKKAALDQIKAAFEKLNAKQAKEEKQTSSAPHTHTHNQKEEKGIPENERIEEEEEEEESESRSDSEEGKEPRKYTKAQLTAWREEARMLSVEDIMERMRLQNKDFIFIIYIIQFYV